MLRNGAKVGVSAHINHELNAFTLTYKVRSAGQLVHIINTCHNVWNVYGILVAVVFYEQVNACRVIYLTINVQFAYVYPL